MAIDTVDVGGAARGGFPTIPAARDADGDTDDEAEIFTKPVTQEEEIPDAVKKNVAPGATVAYPKTHPAVTSGMEQDTNGAIIVPRGGTLVPKAVINTERPGGPRDPSAKDSREEGNRQLNDLLAEEVTAVTESASPIAKSEEGIPLIEVIFHTQLGAIVSYFHNVVQSGHWLVLVSYAKAPAQSKFIPKPFKDADGGSGVFNMSITGSDKRTQNVSAIALGIQFSVDDYDFVVMMLSDEEPKESKE